MSKRYFFIDNDIWFKNEKLPPREVELFNVEFKDDFVEGYDKDGNQYNLDIDQVFTKEINSNE